MRAYKLHGRAVRCMRLTVAGGADVRARFYLAKPAALRVRCGICCRNGMKAIRLTVCARMIHRDSVEMRCRVKQVQAVSVGNDGLPNGKAEAVRGGACADVRRQEAMYPCSGDDPCPGDRQRLCSACASADGRSWLCTFRSAALFRLCVSGCCLPES